MNNDRFIKIDEDGFFLSGENRISDTEYGKQLLENLHFAENSSLATLSQDKFAYVEAFDAPLVVQQIEKKEDNLWTLHFPYSYQLDFKIDFSSDNTSLNFYLDAWDRFHGHVSKKLLPFVFSRKAQAEFFNLLDDFDDDGIFIGNTRIQISDLFVDNEEISQNNFWSRIYKEEEPRWELGEAHSGLKDVLAQLKLPRSRILVLGCGSGHDAAFFAEAGHIVTGIDFSPEAIKQAENSYGHLSNLDLRCEDAFKLSQGFAQQFDIIFEHTFYCAIRPEKRNDLIKLWRKLLAPRGHILGFFFARDRRVGPPYGGSEWELNRRLKKLDFRPLYWNRWQQSIPRRQGKELVIFAQKEN